MQMSARIKGSKTNASPNSTAYFFEKSENRISQQKKAKRRIYDDEGDIRIRGVGPRSEHGDRENYAYEKAVFHFGFKICPSGSVSFVNILVFKALFFT